MKSFSKFVLINMLCFNAFPVLATEAALLPPLQQTEASMQQLVSYFTNLGSYFGYNVTASPSSNYSVSYQLLNLSVAQLNQVAAFYTYLGALPVNSFNSNAYSQFIPTKGNNNNVTINTLANNTFNGQQYNSPSSQQISVSPLIDQQTYQNDPVSQSILNILTTPDSSYCNPTGTQWVTNCPNSNSSSGANYLYVSLVPANVVGSSVPNSSTLVSYDYVEPFLSQLNSNALTGPLMYSTESNQGNSTSSPTPSTGTNEGLTAQNQAQIAENFIRYVSGATIPIALPKLQDYDSAYATAYPATPPKNPTNQDIINQQNAQAVITKYLAGLRTYAAINSVGISNLYYILSKRIQQTPPNSTSNTDVPPQSQALSEFNMATWRLFSPGSAGAGNTQWITQLDTAAPATVQKEIALLLAEINYQMYLTRQMHERTLLTQSVLLLLNARAAQPSTDFSSVTTASQQASGQ